MKHLLPILLLMGCLLPVQAQKYAGGDISLLPSYEANGALYFDSGGTPVSDVVTYLKGEGWNAMRVRLFVDPGNAPASAKGEGVRQSLDYIVPLCKRIKAAGMKLLLDFHYSDTWADPGKQWTPDAWKNLDDVALGDTVWGYSARVLRRLVAEDATPDFIQVGNEISYGMMVGAESAADKKWCWPGSPKANWVRFANLLAEAIAGCRQVCPDAKIILHTERVSTSQQADNKGYAALMHFYDYMAHPENSMGYVYDQGMSYDIIGLSYYPYFHGPLDELETAIDSLARFGKDIMVVETGYPAQWAVGGTTYDYTATFPYTEDGQQAFTDSLVAMLNRHGSVKGLFWWFPEANEYGIDWATKRVTDSWYNATLFNNQNGRAFKAVSSLRRFVTDVTAVEPPHAEGGVADPSWYTLSGQRLGRRPQAPGVYVHEGKKAVMR